MSKNIQKDVYPLETTQEGQDNSPHSVLCFNCNNILHTNDVFCPVCGTKNYRGPAYSREEMNTLANEVINLKEDEDVVIVLSPFKLGLIIAGAVAVIGLIAAKIFGWI